VDANTRTKVYDWVFLKQIAGLFSYHSYEKGVHKLIGSDWQWQTLNHQGIALSGAVVGGTVTCNITSAVNTVGTYYSGMQLYWATTQSFVWKGSPVNLSSTGNTGIIFNVND